MTINTTSAQDARLLKAFGQQLSTQDITDPENPVPRDATPAEVKQQVIQFLKGVVHAQERRAEIEAINVPDF